MVSDHFLRSLALSRITPSPTQQSLYSANYGSYHGRSSWKVVQVRRESGRFTGMKLNSYPLVDWSRPDFEFSMSEDHRLHAPTVVPLILEMPHGAVISPSWEAYHGNVFLGNEYTGAVLILTDISDTFIIFYMRAQFRLVFRSFSDS